MLQIEQVQNKVKVLKAKLQDKKQDNIRALRKSLKRTQRKMRLLIIRKSATQKKKEKDTKEKPADQTQASPPAENKKP